MDEKELKNSISESVISLLKDENRLSELSNNALKLSQPDAAKVIAQNAIKYAEAI